MTIARLTFLITTLLVSSSIVHAQVVAGWDVEGLDVAETLTGPSYSFSSTSTAANVTAALTLSSSVNPSTSADQYGFKVSGGDDGVSATLATAISDGNYFEFTLTAATGYELTLTSIEMNGGATSSGAANVALLSSVDGFNDSSAIATATEVNSGTGGFDTDSSGFGNSITLSGAQYEGLQAISFRIYGWNISSGSGVTNLRSLSGDDLEVFGTVSVSAVPEPSTFALLAGLGALGMVASRRRGRRALVA
ncbi:MAG: hypothetical protein SynsKO_18520 [Synoicihabitans sp.]